MVGIICAGGKFLPSGAINPKKAEVFTRESEGFGIRLDINEDVPFILEATKRARSNYLLITLGPVRLLPGFERAFASALEREPLSLVYSDYLVGGKRRKLFEYPGDITERFPLGYLVGIKRETILNCGLREIFRKAYLYDFRLRLEELGGRPAHIPEVLYEVPESRENGGLFSSFDYLHYPPELEREVEKAFKDMLKRRGAFLSGGIKCVRDEPSAKPLSVIIPVRNRVRFIGKAIESLWRQTFDDFEVVITDTGSTDGTRELIVRYADRDSRIRPLFVEGGSLARALNICVKNARGRYVVQLDSDDEYVPDALETAFSAMEKHPEAALGVSYYEVMDEEGVTVGELGVIKHLEFDRNNILRTEGAGALRIWRRSVLLNMGLFDEQNFPDYGEDYDMVLKAVERHDLLRIHRVLYRYRKHSGSSDVMVDEERKIRLKTLARRASLERRRLLNRVDLLSRALPGS